MEDQTLFILYSTSTDIMQHTEQHLQIFITVPSRECAESICRKIVESRLAACAQVTGPITSTYWWDEKIETTEEWLCIMKTRSNLLDDLENEILEAHPYEVPEIVALPIVAGSKEYLAWIDSTTVVIDE